jgi:hypothetical protein
MTGPMGEVSKNNVAATLFFVKGERLDQGGEKREN